MTFADRMIEISSQGEQLRLHVREWSGSGIPFVLLHGLSSNCQTWEQVAQQLAANGHHVLTVDQRGHGLSGKPASGYDFVTVTDDLAALLDALSLDRPIIAGQSWGGNVVLEFAARNPGRALGLVFVDGGFIDMQMRPDATWERIAEELRPPQLIGTPRALLKERIQSMHPDWSNEGIEATLANFEVLPDATVRPWLTFDRHMSILHSLWRQRPGALYPLVQEPVLICPAGDGANPAWSTVKQEQVVAASAGLGHAEVHWFYDTAHDIHVHRPEALAQLLLTKLSSGFFSR